MEERARERAAMVRTQLREPVDGRQAIGSPEVLEAMEAVPRHRFVPESLAGSAYADRPLPLGHGQTISQPWIVAMTCEQLEVGPGDRVLEVGLGSGYQAAVLARIAEEVHGIERIPELAEATASRLRELGIENVQVHVGDGYEGLPEHGPFDAIAVACAADEVPPPLIEQLAPGGRMVLPVGGRLGFQELLKIRKREDGTTERERLAAVGFVPLVRESAS